MTAEQKAAYINAQAAMLNAEIAAAQAENQDRIHRGLSPAYNEELTYKNIISKYEGVLNHNYVIGLFHDHL